MKNSYSIASNGRYVYIQRQGKPALRISRELVKQAKLAGIQLA